MVWCYVLITDIAVIVFNNCTTNNNGKTVATCEEGEMTVTQDSPNFQVTFDYEFLEDFRDGITQRLQYRTTDGRSHTSESGFYESSDVDPLTTGSDRVDGTIFPSAASAALRHVVGADEKWENSWGPEGFNKENHPLNIMVCLLTLWGSG